MRNFAYTIPAEKTEEVKVRELPVAWIFQGDIVTGRSNIYSFFKDGNEVTIVSAKGIETFKDVDRIEFN